MLALPTPSDERLVVLSDETIRGMPNHPPSVLALIKFAASVFSNPFIAVKEYVDNSVQSLLKLPLGEQGELLLRVDVHRRTIECIDNGPGLSDIDVDNMLSLGASGNASADRSGPSEHDGDARGSAAGFAIGTYGTGSKGAVAGLVAGDDGIATEGIIRISSRRGAGEAKVRGGARDFAYINRMLQSGREGDVWRTDREEEALEEFERSSFFSSIFDKSFTRVIIKGVSARHLAKLSDAGALVPFLEEVYHPLLFGAIDHIECTKPPRDVRISIRLQLVREDGVEEEYKLGPKASRADEPPPKEALDDASDDEEQRHAPLPPPPSLPLLGSRPTIQRLLSMNTTSIAQELSQRPQPILELQKAWGESLSFSAPVDFKTPNGAAPIKGWMLLFYLPPEQHPDVEAGLYVLWEGQRLVEQPPIVPRFMASMQQMVGFFICDSLPTLQALNPIKTALTPAYREALEGLSGEQTPAEISGRSQARMAQQGAARQPAWEKVRTLAHRVKDYHKDMYSRNGDIVLVPGAVEESMSLAESERATDPGASGSVAAAARSSAAPDASGDWRLYRLRFKLTLLDANQENGLFVRFAESDDKRYTKTANAPVGRVCYFICRGMKPSVCHELTMHNFDMLVKRTSADERDGEMLFVPLKRVLQPGWLNLELDEVKAVTKGAPCSLVIGKQLAHSSQLVLPDENGRFSITPSDETEGAPIICVSVQTEAEAQCTTAVPLDFVIRRASNGASVHTGDNMRGKACRQGSSIDGKRAAWVVDKPSLASQPGQWSFKWPSAACSPGEYTVEARTKDGFQRPLHAKAHVTVRVGAAAKLVCAWVRSRAPAGEPERDELRVAMCCALPRLVIVATDVLGFVVDVPPLQSLEISFVECEATAAAGRAASRALTLKRTTPVRVCQPWADLRFFAGQAVEQCKQPPAELYVLRVDLALNAHDWGFKMDATPASYSLHVTARVDKGPLVLEQQPSALKLAAGPPKQLEDAVEEHGHPELTFAGKTEDRLVRALDLFGNVVTHAPDGSLLRVSVQSAKGLRADKMGERPVSVSGPSKGCFVIPKVHVTGDFSSEASLTLRVVPPGPSCELTWRIEERALAFSCAGDEGGAAQKELRAGAGACEQVGGVQLRVHLVNTDGSLGAHDVGYAGSVNVVLQSCCDGKTTEQQLGLKGGCATVLGACAPRVVGQCATYTASLGGARAVLTVQAKQGPPALARLSLLHAGLQRAGEPFEVRCELLDASGAPLATAPAGLRWADLFLVDARSKASAAVPLASEWTAVEAGSRTVASCTLKLTDIKKGQVDLAPRWAASSPWAQKLKRSNLSVLLQAGPPRLVALKLKCGSSRSVKNGGKLDVHATVSDAHGNPARLSDVKHDEFELLSPGGGLELTSAAGLKRRAGSAEARWELSSVRLADSRADLPAEAQLQVRWRPTQSATWLEADAERLHVEPTGKALRKLVLVSEPELESFPGAVFDVSVRLLLDDGGVSPGSNAELRELHLAPQSELPLPAGQRRQPRPCTADGSFVLQSCAPAECGVTKWFVRCGKLEELEVRLKVVPQPAPPAPPQGSPLRSHQQGKRRREPEHTYGTTDRPTHGEGPSDDHVTQTDVEPRALFSPPRAKEQRVEPESESESEDEGPSPEQQQHLADLAAHLDACTQDTARLAAEIGQCREAVKQAEKALSKVTKEHAAAFKRQRKAQADVDNAVC